MLLIFLFNEKIQLIIIQFSIICNDHLQIEDANFYYLFNNDGF